MPVPFERFRILNETSKPIRVVNYSAMQTAEVEIDGGAPQPLPPTESMPIPEGTQEVGVRRVSPDEGPIDIGIVVES